jgi:ABC-2 type transport system ATP-binding protein
VFGWDVERQAHLVRRHINRVSVEASFFKVLSPWENLAYATRLHGQSGKQARERALAAMKRLGLPDHAVDRPMKQLSRGQQQKVAIARSLLTSPWLLLMDEPTTGLDPRSKREVQTVVREIHAGAETTVLICTHDLAEAEALCDRVIVMDSGRIVADAKPITLRAEHGNVSLEDVFLKLTGKSFEEDRELPDLIGASP